MAVIDDLRGKRVYLDTNVFIYAVEDLEQYGDALSALFGLLEDSATVAVTSELTLAEVLPKPFEAGREDIARLYQEMLAPSPWLSVVPVERSILIAAARLQVGLALRLPDAIHVATAAATRCEALLSNDRRLKLPPGIALRRLR
jgi:predicted nucleic acid-binding protein